MGAGDMTKTKITTALLCGAALLGMALAPLQARAEVESEDPIILTIHDWTGQYITTTIMGEVLKTAGYNVTYQQADYIAQFAGLESGDLHIAMEMWETTGKQAMEASLETGKTVDLGETGMQAIEEWWYPLYMKEQCPGLPDWNALNDCAELFSTPETAPSGRYLGGPVTWGGFDDERAEALGLDYEVVHAGTDAALFAELQSAYERKDAWLGWIYTRTGRRSSSRVNGWSFRHTATSATPTRPSARTRTWRMTAASRADGSRRSAGKTARRSGLAPTRQYATSGSTISRWAT